MHMMTQDEKNIQLASSWDAIPFAGLVRLSILPSAVVAIPLVAFAVWQNMTATPLSSVPYAIVLAVLYAFFLIGLSVYYARKSHMPTKHMMVVMLFSGVLIGLLTAIAKLVVDFYPLELFRLISEPALTGIAGLLIGAIGASNISRLSNR